MPHVNSLAHQPPQIARANGIDICYEIFGDADAEPMLLIMGLGAQMIHWDDDFCRQLAARGFRVIRFDNRDIGKSGKLTGGKKLTPLELLKLRFLKIPVAAPYKLSDMAQDTVGLMDALKIKSAHLVGASMGGMIAQEIAITFPAAGALADLDHVDHGQPKSAAADPRGHRDADGAAGHHEGRISRALCPDLESSARRLLSRGRGDGSFARRAHVSNAASIRPASDGNCARSSPPAAARSGCARSRRRRWSFTAPSIRWCAPRAARIPRPRSPARNF